jgi:hypothetical protein
MKTSIQYIIVAVPFHADAATHDPACTISARGNSAPSNSISTKNCENN